MKQRWKEKKTLLKLGGLTLAIAIFIVIIAVVVGNRTTEVYPDRSNLDVAETMVNPQGNHCTVGLVEVRTVKDGTAGFGSMHVTTEWSEGSIKLTIGGKPADYQVRGGLVSGKAGTERFLIPQSVKKMNFTLQNYPDAGTFEELILCAETSDGESLGDTKES